MWRTKAAVAMVLIAVLAAHAHAQAPGQQSTLLQLAPALPRFSFEADAALDARWAPRYRPNHWKTGALIGGAFGLAVSTVVVATCEGECPSWDRVPVATIIFGAIGAAIGLFIPAGPPHTMESDPVP